MRLPAEADSVPTFLRAVRRRLWLIEGFDSGRDGLWLSAIALLVLAGIHTWLLRVPPSFSVGAIIIIFMWVSIGVARRRPGFARAAAEADRHFEGQALMTTAVECLPSARLAGNRASRLVLEQANRAARNWQHDIKSAIRLPDRMASTIALVPLFVAAILLTRPGAETAFGTSEDGYSDVQAPLAAGAGITVENSASVLQPSADRAAEAGAMPTAAPGNDEFNRPALSDFSAPYNRREIEVTVNPDVLSPGTASVGNESGDMPGDAFPRAGDDDARITAEASMEQRETIGLQRYGLATATREESALPYRAGAASEPQTTVAVLAAAPPDDVRERTALTRIQASYAERYLSASGESND